MLSHAEQDRQQRERGHRCPYHPTMTDVTETPARWPSSGNRRVLEAEWIELLEREELARYLGDVPASRPTPLVRAIEQFNDGLFWECHETLEDLWLETAYPLRLFYHAIIKTAVGFHHAGRQNRHGATVKLGDGERLLRIFAPSFMGVETARFGSRHEAVARTCECG